MIGESVPAPVGELPLPQRQDMGGAIWEGDGWTIQAARGGKFAAQGQSNGKHTERFLECGLAAVLYAASGNVGRVWVTARFRASTREGCWELLDFWRRAILCERRLFYAREFQSPALVPEVDLEWRCARAVFVVEVAA